MKRLLKAVILAVLALILVGNVVLAAWEYIFPTTVVDTSITNRIYYPVFLGYSGQSLIDSTKISDNGTDTNMQIGGGDIKFMMATGNVTVVLPSLPAGGVVTVSLYTGYTPLQTAFAIITGSGGSVTVVDDASIELSDNFSVEVSGYINTDNGSDKNLVYKLNAFRIFVSPTVSGNITAEVVGSANVTATSVASGNHTVLVQIEIR